MQQIIFPEIKLGVLGPEIILCITVLLLIFLLLLRGRASAIIPYLSLLGVAAAMLYSMGLWGETKAGFHDMVIMDNFSLYFHILICLSAGLTILISINYLEELSLNQAEYYVMLLLSTIGMMLMSSSNDFMMLFLSLELMSLSIYILAGFRRDDVRANESAFKYFLLGAFASGFLLYGMALIYGSCGTTNISAVVKNLQLSPIMLVGVAFLLFGLGFKIAAVPMHMWTPDVYQGAPTSVTAFMASGIKVASFAALLRILIVSFPLDQVNWAPALWILAVLTMTVGNLIALVQTNIKRMLAYSSIAHAGYMIVGLVSGNSLGNSSILYYLLSYVLMKIGAFGAVISLGSSQGEKDEIKDFMGIAHERPFLAMVMTIFLLSLIGIPPTSGFVGKFYIFSAAVKADYIGLAIIGVLNSILSIYYYIRVIVFMYMEKASERISTPSFRPALNLSLAIAAIGIFLIGIFPAKYLHFAAQSIQSLM